MILLNIIAESNNNEKNLPIARRFSLVTRAFLSVDVLPRANLNNITEIPCAIEEFSSNTIHD
jgi:hypothetical protein